MTVQEIANKWAELCKTGQWENAIKELYHQDCVSIEMEGAQGFPPRVEGLEAIAQKGEEWNSMVEELHGVQIDGPIVAGDHFSATMKMDITMKGHERKIDEEVALFRVRDGKIVSEQFFYPV